MFFFFFFNDTATTEIYTLSLHDALPISRLSGTGLPSDWRNAISTRSTPVPWRTRSVICPAGMRRSEEHTSELQSLAYLVCRLLLEKKKTTPPHYTSVRAQSVTSSSHRQD